MRLSLTKRTEYAMRALMHLAARPVDLRMTGSDLAAACDIPAGNIPTIINVLSRGGILDSRPGPKGGCRLARPAATITLLEVIECMEGTNESTVCILDSRRCLADGQECPLHSAWASGRTAALAALAATTLAGAAAREAELAAAMDDS